ncbi:MAG: YjjG family noncanonical pyrimidine nucleotidase [Cytophagales bacterium]|nr:YjjG family noncanonical pyrimidine nucleotidase [Bernardetiaceae bacterium]MDW8210547.1 YjjG family noncanonical pyrimidine nucleotidase [Cytophagales bacterium]
MPAYLHIFFDLDHTLWDFERNSSETLAELYEHYQLHQYGSFSVQEFTQTFHQVNQRLWSLYNRNIIDQHTLRHERFRYIWEALGAFGLPPSGLAEDYSAICPTKPHLLPHARETLDYLTTRYRLHIITNGFHDIQQIKIRSAGIAHYFETVTTSQNAGAKKPQQAIFHYALARIGAAARQAIMVGDNLETDITGAKSSGLDAIFYNPGQIAHQEQVTLEIRCLSELQRYL